MGFTTTRAAQVPATPVPVAVALTVTTAMVARAATTASPRVDAGEKDGMISVMSDHEVDHGMPGGGGRRRGGGRFGPQGRQDVSDV